MKRFRFLALLLVLPLALSAELFAGPRDTGRDGREIRTPDAHGAHVEPGSPPDLLAPVDETLGEPSLELRDGPGALVDEGHEPDLRIITALSQLGGAPIKGPVAISGRDTSRLLSGSAESGAEATGPNLSSRDSGPSSFRLANETSAADRWSGWLGYAERRGEPGEVVRVEGRFDLPRSGLAPGAGAALLPAQSAQRPITDAVSLKPAAVRAPRSWAKATEKLSRWPTWAVFLALSMPQMFTNTINLAAQYPFFHAIVEGVNWGLSAANTFLPWQFGMIPVGQIQHIGELPFIGALSNILADAMLMMFFSAQSELAPAIVQTTGVIMMSLVGTQIFLAGFMPSMVAAIAAPIIVTHLAINLQRFLNKTKERFFFGLISWNGWQKFISILGLYLLIPGIAVTFHANHYPMLMNAALIAGLVPAIGGLVLLKKSRALAFYRFVRRAVGRPFSKVIRDQFKSPGGLLATIFFLTLPVALMMMIYFNPADYMRGVNPYTVFLGMLGNLFMLPRAMFTRNAIWFIGSGWAVAGSLVVLGDLWLHGLASVGYAIAPPWLALGSLALVAGLFGYALKRNTADLSATAGAKKSIWDSLSFLRFWRDEKPL